MEEIIKVVNRGRELRKNKFDESQSLWNIENIMKFNKEGKLKERLRN